MWVSTKMCRSIVSLLGEYGKWGQNNSATVGRAVKLLEKIAIDTEDTELFTEAVAALTQMDSAFSACAAKSLVKILCSCDENESLAIELKRIRNPKLRARMGRELDEIAHQEDHPSRVRAVRCLFVADNDESIFRALIEFLRDQDADVVVAAADALLDMDDRRAIVPVLKYRVWNEKLPYVDFFDPDLFFNCPDKQRGKLEDALNDVDKDIRFSAALVLSDRRDLQTEEILAYHLIHDECWQARQLVAMVIREHQTNSSLCIQAALIQALRDSNPEVVSDAIRALASVGDEMAVEPLINLVDTSEDVCRKDMAVWVLGKLAVAKILDFLVRERDRVRSQVGGDESEQMDYLLSLGEAICSVKAKMSCSQDIDGYLESYFGRLGEG